MTRPGPTRAMFLEAVLSKMHAAYIWGSKGPDTFDCSGLVTWGLQHVGGPDWRQTRNTDGLLALPETQAPLPGDLCLYGAPGDANHVMVWLGSCGLVFGASGGNSKTVTLEIAASRRACVKLKSTHDYRVGPNGRSDFLGFRSLSQYLKE